MTTTKGFTLVELLIVIGILAVLATATVLVLNPGELLAQSRDTTRISDMGTLQSAMSIYLTDRSGNYAMLAGCTASDTGAAVGVKQGYVYAAPTTGTFQTGINNHGTNDQCVLGNRSVSAGWLQVNLSLISSGAPFGSLPVDPTNSGDYIYRANFAGKSDASAVVSASGMFYEANAVMESVKYTGATQVAATDGGLAATNNCTGQGSNAAVCVYEVGNTSNQVL